MSHDRHRVQEDLRGVVAGEVLCSDTMAALYATDAGPFSIMPLGVVRPRGVADVVHVVEYTSEQQIPLHARGAATTAAAQTLGPGIVIDFSRFMRRVLHDDDHRNTVTVEPGAVIGQVNQRLRRDGRTLGFDPWGSCVSTTGGVIARNAAGRYVYGFGRMADQLQACEVVLADGSVLELRSHRLEPDLRGSTDHRVQQLVRRLAGTLVNRPPHHATGAPAPTGIANPLDGIIGTDTISLHRLIAGSEGTLGLITKLTLRTLPLPQCSGILPIFLEGMQQGVDAAAIAVRHGVSACDLLDRRHLTIMREADPRYEMAIPAWAEAMLIVEVNGDDEDSVVGRLRTISEQAVGEVKASTAGDATSDAADLAFYRYLADASPRLLHRVRGRKRPVALADELLVPAERLGQLIAAAQALLQNTGVTASLYAHAADGCLQLRPFLDLTSADDRRQIESLSEAIAERVWDLGGILGGNSACGLLCGARRIGLAAATLDTQREIKRVFDAEGLFNPGKIIPTIPYSIADLFPALPQAASPAMDGVPSSIPVNGANGESANISPPTHGQGASENGSPTALSIVDAENGWTNRDLYDAAAKCSGCGVCRAEQVVRMCPMNHIAPREEASPRAKANLIRSMLRGTPNGADSDESELKKIADLCVHCHMCRLECPAEVDVPRLMTEAKAQHIAANGLRLSDWFMVHVDSLAGFSRRVRHLANWALGNTAARWVLEKGIGVARNRRLPMLERRSFLEEARRRRLTVPASSPHKVAFFVDTYVNHFDTELGLALTAVLEHNDVMVWVPPTQRHAGMPMITRGVLDPARDVARHNTAVLAEAVRQGYTVVATEPSAVLALTREYPALLPGDADAQSVAQSAFDACHYLWQLHQRQQLRLDFKRIDATLGYHAPCHLLALGVGTPAENLMRLIPGLRVERLEYGCSGMAGTYGLQRKNYRKSLRMGLGLITALRRTPLSAGTTECSTCRIQMQHGTDRPTMHPVKVLAMAYGLMPELRRHLFSGPKELTLK